MKPRIVRNAKKRSKPLVVVQAASVSVSLPDMATLRQLSEEITARYYPLPLPTQLFLFDVDPHCLHATWNIREEDWRTGLPLGAKVNEELVLRLFRLNEKAPSASSVRERALLNMIPVRGFSNTHYIYPLKGAGLYQAELGSVDEEGRFRLIIRSNTIHVPPPRLRKATPPALTWTPPKKDALPPSQNQALPPPERPQAQAAARLPEVAPLPPPLPPPLPAQAHVAGFPSVEVSRAVKRAGEAVRAQTGDTSWSFARGFSGNAHEEGGA